MKFLGLTFPELAALTVILTFGWKLAASAIREAKVKFEKFVKEQVGEIFIKLAGHDLRFDSVEKRLELVEIALKEGFNKERLDQREAEELAFRASERLAQTVKALHEVAVKFSEEKPKDFGKVVVKD